MMKRIEFIDVAKFLAMILVIFTHAYKEGRFVNLVFSFHLPLFFFLNGMTLRFKDEPFQDFLIKKIKSYLIPTFFLGVLCIVSSYCMNSLNNVQMVNHYILRNIINLLKEERMYALWFVSALFCSDLLIYAIHKISFKNVIVMGVFAICSLLIGFKLIDTVNVAIMWNLDVAFIGVFFVYIGYLFHHPLLDKIFHFTTDKRWISLLFGIAFAIPTFYLAKINYETTNKHLEMFARIYTERIYTIPCAILGSFAFTFFSRVISNKFFAILSKANLVLLAFHQPLYIPLYREYIFPKWWNQVSNLPAGDSKLILYTLVLTISFIVIFEGVYYLFKYSPFPFIVNEKYASFYLRFLSFLKGKIDRIKKRIYQKKDEESEEIKVE